MKTVKELGEKKVIKIIKACLKMMPNMPIPFGDDVSGIHLDEQKIVIVKTDMLVGKTDIPPGMNLKQAARKAVIMNISDFASKGVQPLIGLSSLGLPRTFNENDVKQIGLGLNQGALEYGCYIVGGDTNETSDLIICCSLFGICEKKYFVGRIGAKPGDIVAVTGEFGKTASGLRILLGDLLVPEKVKKNITKPVLMPKARLREGLALARIESLTASMDSSDGLAWSIHELAEANKVGFFIDNIPVASEVIELAKEQTIDPYDLSLFGGEEYELIFTVKPDLWKKTKELMEEQGMPLIRIGRVTKEKKIEIKIENKIKKLEKKGWEHFRT
jgi:thiamine-monophosphate kinase